MLLNGEWETGLNRAYNSVTRVPGLVGDPRAFTPGDLWLRRRVSLPKGTWTRATLVLKGARFCPAVYVEGVCCSEQEGGMAPTVHPLKHPAMNPGRDVTLEIRLRSLEQVSWDDASHIPTADYWRSNISSCLWDDAILEFHGSARIAGLIPEYDSAQRRLRVHADIEADESADLCLDVCIAGDPVASGVPVKGRQTVVGLGDVSTWTVWSPESPCLHDLEVTLRAGGTVSDRKRQPLGLRDLRVDGIHLRLNQVPFQIRAGTVVWHRWVRDPEARELAFDAAWFMKNIVRRLKRQGANTLRFHLGNPPDRFLDLCDRYGLAVQAEWLFFHGIRASRESMVRQWRAWVGACLRHPSVILIHPWNESENPEELTRALDAMQEVEALGPRFVLSHRDVMHAHRYWWSLFENVGLDYDSAEEFDRPVVADEFGGNYLDGNGDPGGYPSLKQSFMRFLGHEHTREQRLRLHRDANARIAEYWRRIGVAGFSPFCALGSPEDGNHHFLGPLRRGKPKETWAALTAAYAPVSCSLDLWDRNFRPGEEVGADVHVFNDTSEPRSVTVDVQVVTRGGAKVHGEHRLVTPLPPWSRSSLRARLRMPSRKGEWTCRATLVQPDLDLAAPVRSAWDVRTVVVRRPRALTGVRVAILGTESELHALLEAQGVRTSASAEQADLLVLGAESTGRMGQDPALQAQLERVVEAGRSVLLLDVGPRGDGHRAFLRESSDPTLQGPRMKKAPARLEYPVCLGTRVCFTETTEPESCIHPPRGEPCLWAGLASESTQLWNGRRGGLIVPAWDMSVSGLSPDGFIRQWVERGAEAGRIGKGPYVALELCGYYEFAECGDPAVEKKLRERVRFLMEDAPALAHVLNPDGPIHRTDLTQGWNESATGRARSLRSLASAGKFLVRSPVVEVGFEPAQGRMILSQLYTQGRLAEGFGTDGPYGIRFDPVAAQFVLNLLSRLAVTRPPR
jgi:hypothetical protein